MRIGIDCRALAGGGHAGVGHYILGIVQALLAANHEHEFVLFCYAGAVPLSLSEAAARHARAHICVVPQWLRRLPFFGRHLLFARFVARQQCDVFHGPANALPLGIKGPCTVTVHDLAIYAHPEWFPQSSWFSQEVVVPWSLRRAERIIAVSEATKREIGELFGLAHEVVVIPEGCERATPGALPAAVRAPFLLFVGTVEPRKNLPLAIEAFVRLVGEHPARFPDLSLVIAGKLGWKTGETLAALKQANARLGGERVRHLGYVSAQEKAALLERAEALVFPSWYEGFGLPVLEAMAAGCPVLCSDRGALPEVVGDAARILPPDDAGVWSGALKEMLENKTLRQQMAERGREKALMYTWERAAGEMMKAWTELRA